MEIKSCKIADTTREQRERIIKDALAMSILDADPPTDEVMGLVKLYIDGKLEMEEIKMIMLDRYKDRYGKNSNDCPEEKTSYQIRSCKIADTTREQRERNVKDAIAISTLDAPPPSEEAMELFQLYYDGKLEISEIKMILLKRYKERYCGNSGD